MPLSDATKAKIDQHIAKDHVFIASKSYCPYCRRAKQLILEQHQAKGVEVIELDEDSEGGEIQAYLAEKTGQRTVPNIFIDGKHIGGCDDVQKLESNGQLKALL